MATAAETPDSSAAAISYNNNADSATVGKNFYEAIQDVIVEVVNSLQPTDADDFLGFVEKDTELRALMLADFRVAAESIIADAVTKIPPPAPAAANRVIHKPAKKILSRRPTHGHAFYYKSSTSGTQKTPTGIQDSAESPNQDEQSDPDGVALHAEDYADGDAVDGEEDDDLVDTGVEEKQNHDVLLSRLESTESQLSMALMELEAVKKERDKLLTQLAAHQN
jgi:hypothetical protein